MKSKEPESPGVQQKVVINEQPRHLTLGRDHAAFRRGSNNSFPCTRVLFLRLSFHRSKLLILINYSLLGPPTPPLHHQSGPIRRLSISELNVWLWSTVALNATSFQNSTGRVIVSLV